MPDQWRQWVVDKGERPTPPVEPEPSRAPVQVERGVVTKLVQELRWAIQARASTGAGERGTLRKAFADIDADKSGYIEKKEFCLALERFGLHTAQYGRKGGAGGLGGEVVDALFDHFDTDRSGTLDYGEFEEKLLQPERPAPPPKVQAKPRLRGVVYTGAGEH